jgi:hypothetical protein
VEPTSEDLEHAQGVLSRWGRTPRPAEVHTLAMGSTAARMAGVNGGITDADLRDVHDALWASSVRHSQPGVLESLAEALLARGIVPQPGEYDGEWWLWWPKKGRGQCQACGQQRSLTRYSNTFGRPYRYLCGRCRKQELADDTAELNEATGVTANLGRARARC